MGISESLEDYLKSVYQIQIEKDFARVKDVVEILGVKTSSVISALKKLSENGLVDYEKYSYIKLTQAGLVQKPNWGQYFAVSFLFLALSENG